MDIIRPPRLSPGDPVRVVAGSGPVNVEPFRSGAEILQKRYELIYEEEEIFVREGFLAGSDEYRAAALNAALADPECRAVMMARGGYGLTRILPELDQQALLRNPKLIVGYSDVTALLAWCGKVGVAAIHGPMLSDFGSMSAEDGLALFELLENPNPDAICSDLEPLVEGVAEGRLIGGNLEVLTRLLGTPWQPDFRQTLLFLEEVGEKPYRVDRQLTHLKAAGVFDRIKGLILGDFTDCEEAEDGRYRGISVDDVLRERLGALPLPVVMKGGFGHGKRKRSIPCGVRAFLDTRRGTLSLREGVVS